MFKLLVILFIIKMYVRYNILKQKFPVETCGAEPCFKKLLYLGKSLRLKQNDAKFLRSILLAQYSL